MQAKRVIQDLLHKELSYQIHGVAIEVRKDFGPGHKEKLYQKALAEELKRRNIPFEREPAIKIYAPKDGAYVGLYRPDFIVGGKVIVETKAEKFVRREELKRMYDYLRNSNYELVYFVNFASPKLFVKRVVYSNNRKPFSKKLAFISFLLAFIGGLSFAGNVYAQSLLLKLPKATWEVGQSFQVSLVLDTAGQPINTISGTIDVPTDLFQLIDLRYGNSILTLWVERPKIDSPKGIITFAGGVPGGFNGSAGPILSFGLKARRAGSGTITLENVTVLLNDGLGTELKNVSRRGLSLRAVPPPPKPPPPPAVKEKVPEKPEEVYQPPPDRVAPEPFTPLISRHPSIADNKYFVSFSAVDKDSGIAYYEIQEIPVILSRFTTKWNTPRLQAETPHILARQLWAHQVVVRAYDQAWNVTEASVRKPFHPLLVWIFASIAGVVAVFLTIWVMYWFYLKPLRQKFSKFGKME